MLLTQVYETRIADEDTGLVLRVMTIPGEQYPEGSAGTIGSILLRLPPSSLEGALRSLFYVRRPDELNNWPSLESVLASRRRPRGQVNPHLDRQPVDDFIHSLAQDDLVPIEESPLEKRSLSALAMGAGGIYTAYLGRPVLFVVGLGTTVLAYAAQGIGEGLRKGLAEVVEERVKEKWGRERRSQGLPTDEPGPS